jgi:glucokinase
MAPEGSALLAGDVGGTKTRLAIFSPERGPDAPLAEATLPSGRYASLEALAEEFLRGVDRPVENASFGVAGPVVAGRASITNLPWRLDEGSLAARLRLRSVRLVNDLWATAHAVPLLGPADLHTLRAGEPVPGGNRAVIAPGTGLGEAFLTWDGGAYRAHASEGGHADFAPTDPTEAALLAHLWERFEHVSHERVCSGMGLPHLYAFLKARGRAREPARLARALAETADPTPVIVAAALDRAPLHAGRRRARAVRLDPRGRGRQPGAEDARDRRRLPRRRDPTAHPAGAERGPVPGELPAQGPVRGSARAGAGPRHHAARRRLARRGALGTGGAVRVGGGPARGGHRPAQSVHGRGQDAPTRGCGASSGA